MFWLWCPQLNLTASAEGGGVAIFLSFTAKFPWCPQLKITDSVESGGVRIFKLHDPVSLCSNKPKFQYNFNWWKTSNPIVFYLTSVS